MPPKQQTSPLGDYFKATRRPIYSIVAAAPFFIAYELGVIFLMPDMPFADQRRNLAEQILHLPASHIGKHAAYLLPVLLGLVMLFVMHRREKEREAVVAKAQGRKKPGGKDGAGFSFGYLMVMYAEAAVLALPVPLIFWRLGGALNMGTSRAGSLFYELSTLCGAGAYEELLFRLFMFTGFAWLGHKVLSLERMPAGLLAAAVSGVLFALLHAGMPGYNLHFFVFASLAGIYFAIICHFRSFGTAVATHAIYDIMVVTVLS